LYIFFGCIARLVNQYGASFMPLEMNTILFRENETNPIVNKCDILVRAYRAIFESPDITHAT